MSPSGRGRPRGVGELPSRRRRRRRAERRRRRRGLLVALLALAALLVALAAGAGAGAFAFGSSCDLDSLRQVRIGQNSFVYAADGSLLGAIPSERNRQPVPLRRVSPWLVKATIAIEDKRFYEHGGLDLEGIARALWENVKAFQVVQGGSTITQQLVRNLYPVSRARTVQRTLEEACLAIKLNRAWSKQRILSTYLNQVYYGNLAYGVEAASQTYFTRPARSLSIAQSALLAGLTQAPSAYDPFVDPRVARARRDQVLLAMLDDRSIDARQYRAAVARPLGLRPGRLYQEIREPYFFGYVRDLLIREYGAETVRSGGLTVYTTIIPRYQRYARIAINQTLTEPTDPAAAVVSVDPRSGAIRAMTAVIPSRRGKRNEFNLLSQARRQPGSTFKTFVLTTAVAEGIDPATSYYVSAPFTYRPVEDGNCDDGSWWCVKTYDSSYNGWSSIEDATIRSDNTVYAQLTLDLGARNVAEMARRLGVRSRLDVDGAYVPAMGLGSIAVSPLDMASAYATLAAGGVYSEPMAIRRVVLPNGKVDTEAGWGNSRRTRVISDGVAYTVTKILEDNMLSGTGTGAYFGRPAAGKTGTTDEHADAWFAGYTPGLQTTVWMGYTKGEIPMENVHGIAVSGGSFPATIWRLFMEQALDGKPVADFREPTQWPVWRPFNRGPYALSYDPYYVPPSPPPAEEPKDKADKPGGGNGNGGGGDTKSDEG
ncbi:MAG TPA: transglycosylase domain-containing protein [Gaiellaceae bacterium]|nr:transglycosylase domain-containing protein [Gaiellaceae bacterium]